MNNSGELHTTSTQNRRDRFRGSKKVKAAAATNSPLADDEQRAGYTGKTSGDGQAEAESECGDYAAPQGGGYAG